MNTPDRRRLPNRGAARRAGDAMSGIRRRQPEAATVLESIFARCGARGFEGQTKGAPMTEQQIQKCVFEHLRARGAPGIFAWHPFSGGYRKPIEAAIYKSLGVRAGLPDVMVLHNGKLFCVELKKEGGSATPKQIETIAAMEAAGAFTCIAEGLDRALSVIRW
jgi:hypothetical protein